MGMGKPIIASNLEQVGEVLRPSKLWTADLREKPSLACASGSDDVALLVSPGSVSDLAEGICFLLENEVYATQIGENARALALEKYTWKQHVDAILQNKNLLAES